MAEFLSYLSIPGTIVVGLLAFWAFLQLLGEIIELKGKVVPEFMKVRKYFKRKKEEKEAAKQKEIDTLNTLEEVKKLLADVNSHYGPDNIRQRDAWMEGMNETVKWVHERADLYDESIQTLQNDFKDNMQITVDLYINFNRNRILDFASKVADDKALASKEEFNRIYKINRDYHEMLDRYGKENGEVDTAMKIIDEAFKYRMKNHSFIEDIRGYNN